MTEPSLPEESLFARAREIESAAERAAFLDRACGDDRALRAAVEDLLRADARTGDLLDLPEGPAVTLDQPGIERPGGVIGPYKLLQVIGEGGMGTVWMAEQTAPVKRVVALKVTKAGMDSRQVIARFGAEHQALALMDHPNIARVLDAGATEQGRPYFVMELVKGVPITRYCDEKRLTPRERLELFIPVCQAVQHAHQKGVIHRDLKPSNVVVGLYDGKPIPKVIDFGVAKAAGPKLTEATLFTGLGTIIGTPEYMSPEQAQLDNLDIDTRSDIYALGVLLYELLTGTTPFAKKGLEKSGLLEMLRVIREQEPTKPSTKLSTAEGLPTLAANRGTEPAKLTKLVRGDLDWIVVKCLEKGRNRRYETANALARDLEHYLHDEPVAAGPPSAVYRLRKFVRRNKGALALVAFVLFFVVLLGGVVGWAVRDRAAREQQIAEEAARKLALTEEGIRQALDRGTKSRSELQALLNKLGGVQQLLNQPARWELFLKTAQGELAQARRLAVRAEGGLDAELTQALDRLEQQLTSDQADYDLARRLEKIRMDWAILAEGRWDPRKSAEEYRQALAGLGVLNDDPAAVAARLGSSPIKEQLVAALDNWAFLSFLIPQRHAAEQLLALARQVAPDPVWGDRLRQLKVWRDQEAVDKLMAETPPAGLSPQLYTLVGWTLIPETNQRLRESWLRRAQAEHPADFWLNFHLAGTLEETSPVEASGFYRAALAARPGTSVVYSNLGKTLFDQKKLPEALAYFEKAIELDPRHAKAYHNRGVVLVRQEKLPEAIVAFHEAIAIDPKYVHTYFELGWALQAQGKPDEAIGAYRKAIELDPKFAKAHNNLGVVLCDRKHDYEGAAACFNKAIELAPEDAFAHHNLGNALLWQKRWPEAIAAYREAIELDPKNAKAYADLGIALHAQGKIDEAIVAYRNVIELDPKYAKAYNDLAWVLATCAEPEMRDPAQAVSLATKAVELAPQVGTYRNTLGVAHYWAGNWNEALAALQKSMELGSGGDSADWFFLAMAHWKLGNEDEARKWYDQAVAWMEKHQPKNEELLRFRAEAAELLGRDKPKD